MPAFEPATVKYPNGVLKPEPYKNNQKIACVSWGDLNVKLRKPYR